MFSNADLERIVAGEIDLAFRVWQRPQHAVGGRQRTRAGVVGFTSVEAVDLRHITENEAARAGRTLADLGQFLELIESRPAELAETIGASIGWERAPFKATVRRLKELGLTESLPTGDRLSPRGVVVLAYVRREG